MDTAAIGAKFADQLLNEAYRPVCGLACTAWVSKEPLTWENRMTGEKKEINVGDQWAVDVFDCGWFHVTGTVPERVKEKNLVFLINCGGEGLVYDKNGTAKQAITCYASEFDRNLGEPTKRVVFTDGLVDETGNVDFWIDGAANDLFGLMQDGSRFSELCLAVCDEEKRALSYDLQVLTSLCAKDGKDEYLLRVEAEMNDILTQYTADSIDTKTAVALRARVKPLLEEKNIGETFEYTAIGHAHLDLAWLWPIRESKRKGARTFATQMMNIDRYPGYVFGASQAQLYQWIKEDYPDLYEKVKERAKTPYWDVQGATWVEPDSNLISGESLVRQFYYGKKYFQEEFGQDIRIFWVPDSFGYSACIPQVMKLAGADYFLTQKMSWNTVTKFPHHSFKWRGLDGSEVLTHMLPENTYGSPTSVKFARFGEENFQERAITNRAMSLFGISDGGAGAGFEHLERLNRLHDLRSVPKIRTGKSLDFFKQMDDGVTPYPTYEGELYLEKHQGTYTTRTKNKKYNRKCEIALRRYEFLMAAAEANGTALPLTREDVDTIWKEVLLYQFHDILPGSSINRVYDESVPRYEAMLKQLNAANETLLNALTDGEGFFNFTSYPQTHTFKKDGKWFRLALPAMGKADASSAEAIETTFARAEGDTIENDRIKLTFKNGAIISFYDKTLNREFAAEGRPMGVYTQYTDIGDCWDIAPVDYQESAVDASCTAFVLETDGPKAFAKSTYTVGDNVITQCITLTDGSAAAEIDITIDCSQKESMLRCAFPTNIAANEASFNIQFGHIKRPTTENTPAEKAQFEVSAQKFVDLSDGSAGLSLLNDCKYGYRCKNGVIDVDLVRSPKGGPGSNVDQGKQTLKLALLAHEGGVNEELYREAYLLNDPITAVNGTAEATAVPAYLCDHAAFVVEAVKPADDKSGFIARIYNSSETAQTAPVAFAGYRAAETVDILESKLADFTGELTLKPFELICLRFVKA